MEFKENIFSKLPNLLKTLHQQKKAVATAMVGQPFYQNFL